MNREEQIEAVRLELDGIIAPKSAEVAVYLVDSGIGTKDRFEVDEASGKIRPIDYRQKEQEAKVEEASGIQSFMTPESSNIHSVHYDALKELLEVTFKGGGVYRYLAVPASAFKGMLTAESKGKYFNAEIKSRYSYEKVR